MRGLRLEPNGSLRWAAALWNLGEHGFPNEAFDLPVRHRGEICGRFTLAPIPGTAPSTKARRTGFALADLTAAAVAVEQAHHDL